MINPGGVIPGMAEQPQAVSCFKENGRGRKRRQRKIPAVAATTPRAAGCCQSMGQTSSPATGSQTLRRLTSVPAQGCSQGMRLHLSGFRFVVCLLAGVTGVTACSGGKSNGKGGGPPKVLAHPVPADRIRALDSGSGKVVRVDARLKFVVVDFSLSAVPQSGLRLEVVRDSSVVGELRITGPASGSATVADLVAGEAAAGDLARPKSQ